MRNTHFRKKRIETSNSNLSLCQIYIVVDNVLLELCLLNYWIYFFLFFIHTFTVYQCDLHTFTHSGFSQLIFALLTTNLLRLSSCRRSTSCWQLHKKPTFYHSTRHVVWQSVGKDLWKSDLFRCTFIPDTFSTVCLCLVVPLNSSHWAVLAVIALVGCTLQDGRNAVTLSFRWLSLCVCALVWLNRARRVAGVS